MNNPPGRIGHFFLVKTLSVFRDSFIGVVHLAFAVGFLPTGETRRGELIRIISSRVTFLHGELNFATLQNNTLRCGGRIGERQEGRVLA